MHLNVGNVGAYSGIGVSRPIWDIDCAAAQALNRQRSADGIVMMVLPDEAAKN